MYWTWGKDDKKGPAQETILSGPLKRIKYQSR